MGYGSSLGGSGLVLGAMAGADGGEDRAAVLGSIHWLGAVVRRFYVIRESRVLEVR